MLDEYGNVVAPLAQRRDHHRHDIEAIVQVLAETAGTDLVLELLVRRRQHAHVHRARLGAADARHLAVLQHAQHLGLRGERHVADFIEEERAAVRLLELAGPVLHRARERALHVAEQLALDQLAGNRRAIDLDKRARRATRLPVQRPRHEFLARAVLARDEDARVGGRHAVNGLDQRAHRVRPPDDLVRLLHHLAQSRVLLAQHEVPDGIAQRHEDAVGVERLFHDVVGAALRGFHRVLDGGVPADHHHDGRRVERAQLAQCLEPVHPGHLHVEKSELRAELLVGCERRRARRLRAHLIALVFEELRQRVADPLLVVNDEDAPTHRPPPRTTPSSLGIMAPPCTARSSPW